LFVLMQSPIVAAHLSRSRGKCNIDFAALHYKWKGNNRQD
jgi:hypothetical protein